MIGILLDKAGSLDERKRVPSPSRAPDVWALCGRFDVDNDRRRSGATWRPQTSS